MASEAADRQGAWLAGAVLTGGASRRMGRDKATVDVDGRPMATIVATALAAAGCSPVVAVGGSPDALEAIGLVVVADGRPSIGPAGGVLGALEYFVDRAPVTHVAVVACDLPLLDTVALAPLVATAAARRSVDVVAATTHGRLEPAVAIWAIAARERIVALVDGGVRALHAVVDELQVVRVALEPAALLNVNRPGDVPTDSSGWRTTPP